mmetsp:Transcript_102542/g.289590  ORF Transcript_102542/g.289590 Transcript_102542/m.289590 type:complete len:222 (-) Transcript_102542:515-1180(-)
MAPNCFFLLGLQPAGLPIRIAIGAEHLAATRDVLYGVPLPHKRVVGERVIGNAVVLGMVVNAPATQLQHRNISACTACKLDGKRVIVDHVVGAVTVVRDGQERREFNKIARMEVAGCKHTNAVNPRSRNDDRRVFWNHHSLGGAPGLVETHHASLVVAIVARGRVAPLVHPVHPPRGFEDAASPSAPEPRRWHRAQRLPLGNRTRGTEPQPGAHPLRIWSC